MDKKMIDNKVLEIITQTTNNYLKSVKIDDFDMSCALVSFLRRFVKHLNKNGAIEFTGDYQEPNGLLLAMDKAKKLAENEVLGTIILEVFSETDKLPEGSLEKRFILIKKFVKECWVLTRLILVVLLEYKMIKLKIITA